MKMSEAIRGGDDFMGELHGGWCTKDRGCALGAAISYVRQGVNWFSGTCACGTTVQREVYNLFPIGRRRVKCPVKGCEGVGCGRESEVVWIMVSHLHEYHRWSRKAIAEWVEVVEKRLEARREKAKARRAALRVLQTPEEVVLPEASLALR